MCKLIGKMSEFQDEITLAQLKQKLFDEWGERTTLFHSIDKLVATLKALDVVVCDKPGKYHVNSHRVSNPKIVAFMVYTMKYAIIFIACAPMLVLYPFVQKYFVKGVMIGSLKG